VREGEEVTMKIFKNYLERLTLNDSGASWDRDQKSREKKPRHRTGHPQLGEENKDTSP
jgi:hypothetical protein